MRLLAVLTVTVATVASSPFCMCPNGGQGQAPCPDPPPQPVCPTPPPCPANKWSSNDLDLSGLPPLPTLPPFKNPFVGLSLPTLPPSMNLFPDLFTTTQEYLYTPPPTAPPPPPPPMPTLAPYNQQQPIGIQPGQEQRQQRMPFSQSGASSMQQPMPPMAMGNQIEQGQRVYPQQSVVSASTMMPQMEIIPQGGEILSGRVASNEDEDMSMLPEHLAYKKSLSIYENQKNENFRRPVKRAASQDEIASNNKCNDDRLRKIIMENVDENPSTSKRAIQKAAMEQIGGLFDVICSTHDFSYLANTQLFCEAGNDDVTCFAFLHTLLQ